MFATRNARYRVSSPSILTSALMPWAASTSAASRAVPTIFEKVTMDTSVPEVQRKEGGNGAGRARNIGIK